jgi:hypothetical protein
VQLAGFVWYVKEDSQFVVELSDLVPLEGAQVLMIFFFFFFSFFIFFFFLQLVTLFSRCELLWGEKWMDLLVAGLWL